MLLSMVLWSLKLKHPLFLYINKTCFFKKDTVARYRWAVVGIKQIELGFSKIANDHTYSDEFGVKQIILMCLMSDKCGGF